MARSPNMQYKVKKALYSYKGTNQKINSLNFIYCSKDFKQLREATEPATNLDNAILKQIEFYNIQKEKNLQVSLPYMDTQYTAFITILTDDKHLIVELASEVLIEVPQAYQFIFNQSPIGIFTYDKNLILQKCNDRFIQIIQSSQKNIEGLNMSQLNFKKIIPTLEKAIKGNKGYYEGHYLATTSNASLIAKLTTSPLKNQRGSIIGGIGIVEDITQLRKHEEQIVEQKAEMLSTAEELQASNEELKATNDALKQNEERLQLVLESTNDGFWDWHIAQDEMFFSDQYYRMLGYEPGDFPPCFASWKQLLHPDDLQPSVKKIETYLQNPSKVYRIEFRAQTKEGNWKWILGRGKVTAFDKNGKPARVTGTHQDISFQKAFETKLKAQRKEYAQLSDKYKRQNQKLEAAFNDLSIHYEEITHLNGQIKESEQRYRILTENIGEGIIVADTNENITFCNSIAEKIFDLKPGELQGKNLAKYITAEAYNDIQKRTAKRQLTGIDSYELLITTPKGNVKNLLVTASPHFDAMGNFTSTIGIFHDITERKRMEKQLEEERNRAQESDRLKAVFLQNISHEVRTPMNAIMGFSDLLNHPSVQESKRRDYISAIQKSTTHLLSIINDLVDISVLESNKVKVTPIPVNINSLLLELKMDADSKLSKSEKKSLHLEEKFPEKCNLKVFFDKQKLMRILSIFLDNAIKFTHKGAITIGCKVHDKNHPIHITFFVKDTGIGIPLDKQKDIFDPFRQADEGSVRKYGGNGLGLTIAKRLSELLQGKIALESEENKGTLFSITIPVNQTKGEDNYGHS